VLAGQAAWPRGAPLWPERACPAARRIPVAQVQVKINDVWVNMKRANNNQWPYYNTNGPW